MFSLNVDLYQLTLNITIRMQKQHIWTRLFLALWTLPLDLSLVTIPTDPAWTLCWWIQRRNLFRKWDFFLHLSRAYTDSILLHVMIYLSYCVLTGCDFGYYGYECRDQGCSSFCKKNHETVITWQDSVKMGVKVDGVEMIVLKVTVHFPQSIVI